MRDIQRQLGLVTDDRLWQRLEAEIVLVHPWPQLYQHRRPRERNLRLFANAQRQSEALHLEQNHRGYPHPRTPAINAVDQLRENRLQISGSKH